MQRNFLLNQGKEIPFNELDLTQVVRIGEGSFGHVYKVKYNHTFFAIKVALHHAITL